MLARTATSLLRSSVPAVAARRSALAASGSSFAMAKRGYAEAVSDKLQLSFILPHAAIYASQEVTQVNVSTASGDMGVLSAHVPSVESLRPGLVEVIEQSGSKKYFGQ